MIKVLIFDYFDVFQPDGYKRWLQNHGYERTGAFLEASEKNDRGEHATDKDFFQAIADASGETVEDIEREMRSDVTVNTELVEYIDTLRDDYRIALLSNAAADYLRHRLTTNDLERLFHEIVISSEVKLIKPEPEVFKHIMQKLDAKPEECVFVDDNPGNVAAAEKLGIHGIVYTDMPSLKQKLTKILG